jgi:molybdopterin adenylyltransferase
MPYRAVILAITDEDSAAATGPESAAAALIELLPQLDAGLVHREVIPKDLPRIRAAVRTWVGRCDLILTTGGTGVAPRDVTPEAVAPLIERGVPGFGEAIRMQGFAEVPVSIVSRGGGGIAGQTLVVWLPGATVVARRCLSWLAPAIGYICAALHMDADHASPP